MRMFAALVLWTLSAPAWGQSEMSVQRKLCRGMEQSVTLDDRTTVDCVSKFHAIEIDWSEKWAEGVGQALHYAAKTGKEPGLVLVCRKSIKTCEHHYERARNIIRIYGVNIKLWECDLTARHLEGCATDGR